jgi:diadenosine tetraphosphate (Ap4A) HIT family hydrolase
MCGAVCRRSTKEEGNVLCSLCDEFSGGQENEFSALYGAHLTSRVWLSAPNFLALPSLGPLSAGHSLIVPRRHALSLGHVPAELQAEFHEFKNEVREALRQHFGAPLWFEHGCVDDRGGGCGIYHAHLHAVPVDRDLPSIPARLSRQFSGGPSVDGWQTTAELVARGAPYLYFETRSGQQYVYEVEQLPSQFMRRLIAAELGHRPWDWRAAGFEESLVSTVRVLEGHLALP